MLNFGIALFLWLLFGEHKTRTGFDYTGIIYVVMFVILGVIGGLS